jgi:hypothetical protein
MRKWTVRPLKCCDNFFYNLVIRSIVLNICNGVGFVFCYAELKKQLRDTEHKLFENEKEYGKLFDRMGCLVQVRGNVTTSAWHTVVEHLLGLSQIQKYAGSIEPIVYKQGYRVPCVLSVF